MVEAGALATTRQAPCASILGLSENDAGAKITIKSESMTAPRRHGPITRQKIAFATGKTVTSSPDD
jgi:hypothetical protein